MKNPIGWFEIYVQDLARARAFYEAVFGFEFSEFEDAPPGPFEMLAFPSSMEEYGAAGALARMDGVPSGGNSVLVYFHADDCAVEAARVEDAGGKLVREKMSIGPYGFIALATDTEGNMFGIHSMQ